MKKIYLTLVTILSVFQFTYAQWTTSGNNIYNSNSGNIGIGTTLPTAPLDIFKAPSATPLTGTLNFSSYSAGTSLWGFRLAPTTYDFNLDVNDGVIAAAALTVQRATHNLGIGTTTPQSTLHVVGTATFAGNSANIDPSKPLGNLNFLANSGQMLIGWNRSAGMGETDFIANQAAGANGGFAFYNHDNTNSNNETQLMWIMGGGNVLIGKSTQINGSYKLDVNGTIRANGIVVNSTGADFVFEPTYRLNSLSGLKKYINKNHHLPEIPSAKQMQTEGLNVGDNQIKLLQKVEELTLYAIASDKNIKEEKTVIAQQQSQLKAQQEEIDQLKQQMQLLIKAANKN